MKGIGYRPFVRQWRCTSSPGRGGGQAEEVLQQRGQICIHGSGVRLLGVVSDMEVLEAVLPGGRRQGAEELVDNETGGLASGEGEGWLFWSQGWELIIGE